MFIEYAAGGRSTRDKELLDSKAKAHAAKWAYHKSLQRRRGHSSKLGTKRTDTKDKDKAKDEDEDEEVTTLVRRSDYEKLLSHSAVNNQTSLQGSRLNPAEQFLSDILSPEEYWQFNQDVLSTVGNPIQAYPTHLDSNGLRSIGYFPELWSRWAADVIPNRAERQVATDTAVTGIVQRCLTDELHMNAFISYVLQRDPSANVSKTYLLRIASKALTELRSRINNGFASLEEVVWPIIFLAHYELFGSKSVAAGRSHLKAVVELGGMEYLDEVTKVYIRRMDRGWWSDYPSIFPPSYSPRPALEKLVPEISNRESTGSGFFDHAEVLGWSLTNMLPFIADCVRAGVLCKDSVLWGQENEVLQNKVIRQCQTIMDRLREQLPAEPERMACIYPAMIWLQYTTWVMRDLATKAGSSPTAYRKITLHAHPNLLRCVEDSSRSHEMLLWAAAVGIATSPEETTRVQYASRALNLARILDIVDLRNSWKRYLWFDTCAIVDYGFICIAFDKAVMLDARLETQHWAAAREALLHDSE